MNVRAVTPHPPRMHVVLETATLELRKLPVKKKGKTGQLASPEVDGW